MGLEEEWRRIGERLEEDWRRIGEGQEEDWMRIGGGQEGISIHIHRYPQISQISIDIRGMATYAKAWRLHAGWSSLTLAGRFAPQTPHQGGSAPLDPPKYGLVTPQYGDCVQDGRVTPQDGLVTPLLWGLRADLFKKRPISLENDTFS